jgi:hypothetical protein
MLWWAPLNLSYFTTGLYFSVAFMYYLKRYKTAWWEKYNYVLAAAFQGGVAFSGLIIFFAVQYHPIVISWVSSLPSPLNYRLMLTIIKVGKQRDHQRRRRIRRPDRSDSRITGQGLLRSRQLDIVPLSA